MFFTDLSVYFKICWYVEQDYFTKRGGLSANRGILDNLIEDRGDL